MKNSMKLFFAVLAVIMLGLTASASAADGTANIDLSLLRYTPDPAEPGNYVTLTLTVRNTGTLDAGDVRIRTVPEYPFSLDNGSTVRIENSANPVAISSDGIVSLGMLPHGQYTTVDFRMRVDPKALEGESQITFWYQPEASDVWVIDSFSVLVQGTVMLEADVMPSILSPGQPTNATFVIYNSGTASIRDVSVTLGEKDNVITALGSGNIKFVSSVAPGENAEVPVTLIADPGVASGVYVLNADMDYTIGSNISKTINLEIGMFVGGSGEFYLSLQESQASAISLSVANIGVNPATSVVVSIPEQQNFTVTGPSSSFIGNLNPGDFTLASFSVVPKGSQGMLKVDISYTDTNGRRQTAEKEITITSQEVSGQAATTSSGTARSGSGLTLIAIGVVGIIVVILVFRYRKWIGRAAGRK